MGGLGGLPARSKDHKMMHHDRTKIGSDSLSIADLFSSNSLLATELPQPPSIQAS